MKKLFEACLMGGLLIMLGLGGAAAYDFGSKVVEGDSDLGYLLVDNISPEIAFWDIGSNGYDEDDPVYLDLPPYGTNINDIRLTAYGDLPAGTKVTANDLDAVAVLESLDAIFAFTNLYGSNGYDLTDPVYLHIITGNPLTTETNDVRLNKINGLDAGTKVLDYHGDHNKPLVPLVSATVLYFNTNGNYDLAGDPIYDYPDQVYLDLSLPGEDEFGFVVVNDVRLSE